MPGIDNIDTALEHLFPGEDNEQDTTEDTEVNTEVETEPTTEPTPEPAATETENATNQAFAKMRAENAALAKQIKAIEDFAKSKGAKDLTEFLAKEQAVQVKEQAVKNNLPEQVQKELNELKQFRESVETERKNNKVVSELRELASTFNLKETEVRSFLTELHNQGHDIFNSGVTLRQMYAANHYENLMKNAVKQAEQNWLASLEGTKQGSSIVKPASLGGQQKTAKSVEEAMAELFKK